MSIRYIAILDYEHLDNGLFLTSFAKAISSHSDRGLILHSDSTYTDRIMQTGVMREEARVRSIKDLNHRLIALLADQGVSAVGINGYQKELLSAGDHGVEVDIDTFNTIPNQPFLVVSSLIHSKHKAHPVAAPLPSIASALAKALKIDETYLFTRSDDGDILKKDLPANLSDVSDTESFVQDNVPKEFHSAYSGYKLTTPSDFGNYPDIKNVTNLQ